MNELETTIFQNIKDLCGVVPIHVDKWRTVMEKLVKQVRGISNLAEQMRAVTEANIEDMDNFKETQDSLRYNIITCIEEDLKSVRETVEKISRINTELKNRLVKLETSSLDLDWDEESILLKGTPTIPPLGKLLTLSLEFYTFFNSSYKNMQTCTKSMDWLDEENMKTWENAFNVDLDNSCVNYLIAITQYVDNEVVLT